MLHNQFFSCSNCSCRITSNADFDAFVSLKWSVLRNRLREAFRLKISRAWKPIHIIFYLEATGNEIETETWVLFDLCESSDFGACIIETVRSVWKTVRIDFVENLKILKNGSDLFLPGSNRKQRRGKKILKFTQNRVFVDRICVNYVWGKRETI